MNENWWFDEELFLRPCINRILNIQLKKNGSVDQSLVNKTIKEMWKKHLNKKSFVPYIEKTEKKNNHHYLILKPTLPPSKLELLLKQAPFLKPKLENPLQFFISPFQLDTLKAILVQVPPPQFRLIQAEAEKLNKKPLRELFNEIVYKKLRHLAPNSTFTTPQIISFLDANIPDYYSKLQLYGYVYDPRESKTFKKFVDYFSINLDKPGCVKINYSLSTNISYPVPAYLL